MIDEMASSNRRALPTRRFLLRRGSGLLLLAVLLQVAAGVGLIFWAGPSKVKDALGAFNLAWLVAMVIALTVSFVGYYAAYQDLYRDKHGAGLGTKQMIAVAGSGFGVFAFGGLALDRYALRSEGVSEREAAVRVASLGGLEHGILGIGAWGAAVGILILGHDEPPLSFTLPWAIAPVPGFVLAFYLARRYEPRFGNAEGWRRKLGVFVDSILLIRGLFEKPHRHLPALLGMTLFWAADFFAAWAGLAMFGFHMNVAAFIVGMATGTVFSRRTGPIGGAGILCVALVLTVTYSGAPFAVAVAGILAYRVVALWLPIPFSLAALPTLRRLGSPPQRAEADGGDHRARRRARRPRNPKHPKHPKPPGRRSGEPPAADLPAAGCSL